MTVIAYRDGVLASDSRITSGKDFLEGDSCTKIYRLSDGSVVGLAGDNHNGLLLLEALREASTGDIRTLPKGPFKKAEALLVSPRRKVFMYSGGWYDDKHMQGYYAIGSGSIVALGAMDAGATAVEAVKIGIKRSVFCGGRVQKLEI